MGTNVKKEKIRWLICCEPYLSLQLLGTPHLPPLQPRHWANLCSARRPSSKAAPAQNAWSPVSEPASCSRPRTQDSALAFPTPSPRSHQPVLCHPSLPHNMWVILMTLWSKINTSQSPSYICFMKQNYFVIICDTQRPKLKSDGITAFISRNQLEINAVIILHGSWDVYSNCFPFSIHNSSLKCFLSMTHALLSSDS